MDTARTACDNTVSSTPQPAPDAAARASALARVRNAVVRHFPPGQFGRYLVVGLVNTAFGYGAYAALTALLTPHIPFAYMAALLVANVVNITFSFLNYKWFIFKTHGNYLREWSRCLLVSGSGALLGTLALPFVVFALRALTPANYSAPYIAGALLMGVNIVAGFLGHRNFSFAS